MGLSGLYSAGRITGMRLTEQRILFVGAGEAGLGFGQMVVAAMQLEGLSDAESRKRCLFMDSRGLVVTSRADLSDWKRPFAPVTVGGRDHTPGQGNNAYVFPGIGLGLLLSGARRVTDEMFFAAARALADCVSTDDLEQGRVFPAAARMREVAVGVAAVAHDQGQATRPRAEDFAAEAASKMYVPEYT